MTRETFSGNTAKTAGKKKPRGKAFTGSGDPRNNRHGQRSREVVALAAQARALYVQILHEPDGTVPSHPMNNLERIVRDQVVKAARGVAPERELMLDRIWGKVGKGKCPNCHCPACR